MDKIPSPGELGLPDKFDKWRSGQEDAIHFMTTSLKRTKTVCAPTGHGKSPAIVAASIISQEPTCIVTSTRGLQTQYMSDFSSIGLVNIMGRRNYACDMKPDATCEEGYASRCPYKGTVACPSSQAEMRAATSSLVVTNFDKWTSARRFGQGMNHFTQVIFDEGHDAPDALARAMQVILNRKEIEETLKLKFPKDTEVFLDWKIWASKAKLAAEIAMIEAQARIAGLADPKLAWVRHYTHMRNLTRRLSVLAAANVNDWVVEHWEDNTGKSGYQFDPIRPGKYAESALLLRVPSIIFVSATIRPKTMYMCGISGDKFDFKEFDSDFNPRRSPIWYVPTMRVDGRADNLSPLWLRVDQTLAKRQDRKGMIQTTSYQYQKDVREASRFSGNMLLNEKGEPPTEMIEQFLSSPAGTSLVSPSVGTGYDFPGDSSRYNIILKVPFDPPSKILKAREEDDKEYRSYRAMQSLVQKLGRDVRSKSDWSERFIFDDHFSWFYPRYAHLAPKSFHAFVKNTNILPQPPDLNGDRV